LSTRELRDRHIGRGTSRQAKRAQESAHLLFVHGAGRVGGEEAKCRFGGIGAAEVLQVLNGVLGIVAEFESGMARHGPSSWPHGVGDDFDEGGLAAAV
jgi:hypothetical protein